MNVNKIFVIVILFIGTLISSQSVKASSGELPFSVEPILPFNQEENILGYISMNVNGSNLNQNLEFILKNNTDKKQEIIVEVENAYTSPNNIIQYMNKSTENSAILKKEHELRKYVENKSQKVTLLKNEERKVVIPVNVESYEGTLLGGVSFTSLMENESNQQDSNFQIENELKVLIGVVANFNDVKITKDMLSFEQPYIDPMLSYYAVRMPTTFDGAKPKKFNLKYKVSHNGQELFSNSEEFSFAPKTKTNIPFPWMHESILENEIYVLEGSFTHSDNNNISTPFKFEVSYDSNMNENYIGKNLESPDLKLQDNQSEILKYILILIMIPIALLIALFMTRKKRFFLIAEENPPEVIMLDDILVEKLVRKKVVNEKYSSYVKYKDYYKRID